MRAQTHALARKNNECLQPAVVVVVSLAAAVAGRRSFIVSPMFSEFSMFRFPIAICDVYAYLNITNICILHLSLMPGMLFPSRRINYLARTTMWCVHANILCLEADLYLACICRGSEYFISIFFCYLSRLLPLPSRVASGSFSFRWCDDTFGIAIHSYADLLYCGRPGGGGESVQECARARAHSFSA